MQTPGYQPCPSRTAGTQRQAGDIPQFWTLPGVTITPFHCSSKEGYSRESWDIAGTAVCLPPPGHFSPCIQRLGWFFLASFNQGKCQLLVPGMLSRSAQFILLHLACHRLPRRLSFPICSQRERCYKLSESTEGPVLRNAVSDTAIINTVLQTKLFLFLFLHW